METLSKLSHSDITNYVHLVSEASLGTYDEEFPKDNEVACQAIDESIGNYNPGSDPLAWQEYAIRDGFGGDLIGLASYRISFSPTMRKARVGIHLGERHRGKGYATKALRELVVHLSSLGVSMIDAVIDPENAASIKLFTRNGFKETGVVGGDLWYYLEL
jgi:RimJ/RimL family protein N-acetyltransferase